MVTVVVTGAAGQIAYSLLPLIASGAMLGEKQTLSLRLLDLPAAEEQLRGVAMELEDCAFPLLKEVRLGSDPLKMFEGADVAMLVGARPRGPGMERKELLEANAKIFIEQGRALAKVASKEVTALVVGNPCNTNCLLARSAAEAVGGLDLSRFYAMTRLDQNRARSMLAAKAALSLGQVERVSIWGNHSSTQVVDFEHVLLGGKPAADLLPRSWLEGEFVQAVQQRGAKVIAARGKSSAASAAQAAMETVRALMLGDKKEWLSVGQLSDGNSYGISEGLIFSFPSVACGAGRVERVEGLALTPWLREALATSEKELLEERQIAMRLLA